jgi:DNA-binding MarR family transcriptional regulator
VTTLRRSEQIILDALAHAAEHNQPCPINMDLEFLIGADSTSTASWIIARLEEKGLIKVERFQRFRVVEIVKTGKRTARSPSMHTERPHVPRGVRSGVCHTDRKLYRKGLV